MIPLFTTCSKYITVFFFISQTNNKQLYIFYKKYRNCSLKTFFNVLFLQEHAKVQPGILQYGPRQGSPRFRKELAKFLSEGYGDNVDRYVHWGK